MDAKDLRTATALSERSDDGNKYAQSGTIQCNKYKPYQDIGSNSSVKVDTSNNRPCAVIGPDRVLPPADLSDAYFKKASVDPWPCPENTYYRPPEYIQKIANYQNPARNISPRQTFQENMQRIMVAPTYNAVKLNDETTYLQLPDRNIPLTNNSKMSISADSKYCDVPYTVIPTNNDSKTIRNAEICVPNVNPNVTRSIPHGWPPSTINVRPQKPYVSSEVYPTYPEYPSCAGPRHAPIPRSHRVIPEEPACVYPEPYYHESNIRFKPYPNVKEKYQQSRYDYLNNYSNPFHPPPFLPHKYDLQKPIPPLPYPGYPHLKYIDNRISEPILDGFQRPVNQQNSYSLQYRNQVIQPTYGQMQMMASCSQGKLPPYPPDSSNKQIPSNKHPYDNNNKMYVNYESSRLKPFTPTHENFYVNETSRIHPIKSQGIMPNFSPMMHSIPHPYYKKENSPVKTYDYANHFKNINQSMHMSPGSRYLPQFSPNTLATSPTDSTASNETMKTQGTTQEDCGYVSQSSTTSVRSMDSGIQRINDYYGRFDYRYRPVIRSSPISTKSSINANSSTDSKEKKDIDVRQFLQMWNEGDEENIENRSNKESVHKKSIDINYLSKQHEAMTNQEQLYVLGLVNVPSEELSKYQHIQRVSKLPENIKGYTNIELLNQFEEVIESSNIDSTKKFQMSSKEVTVKQTTILDPRPVSPLDVEAKISQSIIHKDVGCNFEIKPCSPKMLNVEIAAPVHNILTERTIEKVTNPLSTMINSPVLSGVDENINECNVSKRQNKILNDTEEISSCKMKNTQFSANIIDSMKNSYSVHDLENNLSLCLASLPRLDNDIELNFPEVNQQFINANKGEQVISTSMKDLPDLDVLEQSDSSIHIETLTNENKTIEEFPNKSSTEKEFKKLSQYRKIKSCDSDNKTVKLNPVLLRTDSVIIKNPENTKSLNMCIGEDQETPINLTSQSEVTSVNEVFPENNAFIKEKNINCLINDIAVDCTLNKNKDLSSNDCKLELKPTKKCELIEDNSSKDSSSFIHCSDNDLIVSSDASFTYTNVSEANKPKSMFDLTSEVESTTCDSNKNTENNEQSVDIADLIESEISISDNSEVKMTNDTIIINGISTPEAISNICELQKKCTAENKTSSNDLIDKEIQDSSLSELIGNSKILVEMSVQENHGTHNKENSDLNQLLSDNINADQTITADTLTEIILNDKLNENNILDPEPETNNDVVMNDKDVINNNTEINGNHEQLNFPKISSIQDSNIAVCNDSNTTSEMQSETISQTELIPNEKSCNDIIFNEICNMSVDDKILDEIEKSPCQGHDLPTCHLKKVTSVFPPHNLSEETEIKSRLTNYENKVGYVSKKLYSPWIRKLIIHNEGLCIPFSQTNEISPINEIIENQYLQKDTNVNFVDKEDIINKKKNANDLFNRDLCDDYDLNSKEHKMICNSSVEAQPNNIYAVTEEPDEILINTVANILRGDEVTTPQEYLDINNSKIESVPTISKKSENDFFLDSEKDILDSLTSEKNELVCTSVNYEETEKNENECEMKQDESKNNLNSDNSYVIESNLLSEPRSSLKRSLSDSAINQLRNDFQDERGCYGNTALKWTSKRKKTNCTENTNNSNLIAQKLCNMLQNRRNSISSICNDENVSFCILIDDNCIITEENEEIDKICFTNYSEDGLEITNDLITEEEPTLLEKEAISYLEEKSCDYPESFVMECNQEKSLDDAWVQDVACVETVVSDDVAEDIVISALSSPKNYDLSDNEESAIYSSDLSEHTEKVKYIYGEKMCSNDAHFVETLYNTPQMDVNKTLITRDPHIFEPCSKFYDTESLEKILSECNNYSGTSTMLQNTDSLLSSSAIIYHKTPDNKENISNMYSLQQTIDNVDTAEPDVIKSNTFETTQDYTVNSCESSNDNIFSYDHGDETINYTNSRSPEVSSTTSEERNSSILLKITNYKGSITSQVNEININNNRSCCKFTENSDYIHSNTVLNTNRPLITKAAQKYIPPLKETIRDLKVQLPLPQKSLLKLKQLKLSKDEPKVHKYSKNIPIVPKKSKPKFEDVLKSIDEIQFKMHKEKTKKGKKSIPKVVIKKNENGSHYASTSNQDTYNPDLTGRKWQPWVFLEKNHFIDKMALKNKNKAVFSYRKNTYVLAEKFYKYKSVNNTKFFIAHQKFNASSTGHLKCTIKLKHNY